MTDRTLVLAVLEGRADERTREEVQDLCLDLRTQRMAPGMVHLLSFSVIAGAIPATFGIVFLGFILNHNMKAASARSFEEQSRSPIIADLRIEDGGRTSFSGKVSIDDLPDDLTRGEQIVLRNDGRPDSYICSAERRRWAADEGRIVRTVSRRMFSNKRRLKVTLKYGQRHTVAEMEVPCSN